MFYNALKSQTLLLLKGKGTIITFCLLLNLVIINFINNVIAFQGTDVIEMYQPMKLLLLSYNRVNYNADMTLMMIQLYPILVVCPAGFAFANEYLTGCDVLISARMGYWHYKVSKIIAVFFTTMLVFTLPFLIEVVLNCIAFPLAAEGDLTNWNRYEMKYVCSVQNYLFSDYYVKSPYLYAISGIVFWGVISGILGGLTSSISVLVKAKYRIFLFMPVFLLLNVSVYLSDVLSKKISIKWYDYVMLFNDQSKSIGVWIIGMLGLIFCVAASIFESNRKDLM